MKANLVKHGFDSEVLYLNFRFADRIGAEVFDWLTGSGPALIGDMIFSDAAHGLPEDAMPRYVDEVLAGTMREQQFAHNLPGEATLDAMRRLSNDATDFIRGEAIDEVLARDPWLVGVSSTFTSNAASLALVREIKKRRPDIITLMGGANCEKEMGEELMSNYPEIDYIGRGECDKTIVEFVRTLREGKPARGVVGFMSPDDETPTTQSRPLHAEELDELPYPDFSDYFGQLESLPLRDKIQPGLIAETSRGCWWGAKSHCTFCAFNREGMVFRSKSPQRAMDEIQALIERYDLNRIEMTDNILDMTYFRSLVPELEKGPKIEFFWETKANLSRDQVRQLARAGSKWIQPGIESLSDLTLKLMRKGSTQLQNVQLLKWCTESGVKIIWNWLFGFPGEDESEMGELTRVARALHHLQPPGASPVLYLERFAPYQATPEQWGLEPIRPAAAYAHVYPHFTQASLDRMAFFLECDALSDKEKSGAHKQLLQIVADWNEHAGSHFLAVPNGDTLDLYDTRPCAKQFHRRLRGVERKLYLHCWKIRGERDLQKLCEGEASPEQITTILRSFVDDSLMLQRDDRFLSVATDPRLGYRSFPQKFPGGHVIEKRHLKGDTQPAKRVGKVTKLLDLATGKLPLREVMQRRKIRQVFQAIRADLAAGKVVNELESDPPKPIKKAAGNDEQAA